MKNASKYLIFAVVVVVLCGASYLVGRNAADELRRAQVADALTMQRLLWIRTDVGDLTLLRQGKVDETIRGMETVVESGLKTLDVERAKAAPLSSPDLEKTKQALVEYTKNFPTSQLDPKKNTTIEGMLAK